MELLPFIEANQGAILLVLVIVNAVQLYRSREHERRIGALEKFVYPSKQKG